MLAEGSGMEIFDSTGRAGAPSDAIAFFAMRDHGSADCGVDIAAGTKSRDILLALGAMLLPKRIMG